MKIIFVDTETTGLPKDWKAPITDTDNWPRVVEYARILTDAAGAMQPETAWGTILKPLGFEIPKEASDIHGITTDKAMAEGVDAAQVLTQLHGMMQKAECLAGHNIRFDLNVLNCEFHRLGLPPIEGKPLLCTMMKGRAYGKGGKWPKLTELYFALFGKEFSEAHRALSDITATAECFYEMVARHDIEIPVSEITEAAPQEQKADA